MCAELLSCLLDARKASEYRACKLMHLQCLGYAHPAVFLLSYPKRHVLWQAKRASPAYMAPELFQNAPQSTASDLWALGCIMYECAAGAPPFAATSLTRLVQDIMTADPAPIPGA